MQIWIIRDGVVLLVVGSSIAASYLAVKALYRCRTTERHQRELEQFVDNLQNVIESLAQEIKTLSERLSTLEIHTRSNTTALRAYNTSTKLNLHKCAETIGRLQGRSSFDDIAIVNELRSTSFLNVERRSPQPSPDCTSPSRRLESRFKALCRHWSVGEAACRTMQEFQESENIPDTVLGAAELRLEALISLQSISVQKKNS